MGRISLSSGKRGGRSWCTGSREGRQNTERRQASEVCPQAGGQAGRSASRAEPGWRQRRAAGRPDSQGGCSVAAGALMKCFSQWLAESQYEQVNFSRRTWAKWFFSSHDPQRTLWESPRNHGRSLEKRGHDASAPQVGTNEPVFMNYPSCWAHGLMWGLGTFRLQISLQFPCSNAILLPSFSLDRIHFLTKRGKD